MPSRAQSNTSTRALWLLPIAAFLAVLPLLLHGGSCGHDQVFHIQGWLDAAQQLRHGHYPQWSSTSAWNAGEPRFIFYPPLSWLLGALLTLLLPITLAPTAFVFIVLVLSGLTFHHLATEVLPDRISPNAALLASALYLSNPYMLFNAFERSAYAELLAAAWIPFLLLSILRPRPTLRGIALPIALLWLTNAPAAVMGCYTFALLATLRLLTSLTTVNRHDQPSSPATSSQATSSPATSAPTTSSPATSAPTTSAPEASLPAASASTTSYPSTIGYPEALASGLISPHKPRGFSPRDFTPLRLALTSIAGTLLGLALPAFYLLPAAFERRSIQVAMAIVPGMRPQDNFLFAHTPNGVNLQVSLLAVTLLCLTVAALAILWIQATHISIPTISAHSTRQSRTQPSVPTEAPSHTSLPPEAPGAPCMPPLHGGMGGVTTSNTTHITLSLTVLATTITFLLLPPSLILWNHVPDLAFLQLPWRLLTLLTPILTLAIALLLKTPRAATIPDAPFMPPPLSGMSGVTTPRTTHTPSRLPATTLTATTLTASLVLPLLLGLTAFHLYSQYCHTDDLPSTIAQRLSTHHGFPPTDEYTPTHADNDILRSDDPSFWLLPNLPSGQPATPNTPAPHTTPTATELDPSIDNDDTPIPPAQTLSTPAPSRLTLNLPQPETLILHLRDYPNWDITRTTPATGIHQPPSSTHDTASTLAVRAGPRDDGLIAIALPAGPTTLNIAWRRTPDQTLGLILSTLALLALALTLRKQHP